MDASPLAKLAGELRNQIYELVLHEPSGFGLTYAVHPNHKNDFRGVKQRGQKTSHLLAITKVCRQTRRESLPLFYSINTFIHPMNFWRFGSTMNGQQTARYGQRLKHGRKWLLSLGRANSGAVTHYELDLGRWDIDEASKPLWKREWRVQGRRLERKQLLPMLQQKAIFTTITMVFDVDFSLFRHWYTRPACRVGGETFAEYSRSITYTIHDDQQEAAKDIERTYKAKLKEMESHIDHQGCHVVQWLPQIRAGLEKSRALMYHTIGLKPDQAEGAVDGKLNELEGGVSGLQLS